MKERLSQIVGKENVFDSLEILEPYAKDQSFRRSLRPWFVVRPACADQIQELIQWANETRTPLIPVSSGAPHFHGDTVPSAAGAVIIDLSGMKKILRIDRRNRIAVIEPGVTYDQLEAELAKEGLRVTMPLLPRKNKSVVASLLERQPTVIPRYQYSLTEPLRNCGVIWGNGQKLYTGDAGNGPYNLEDQWKAGMAQVDPKGPNATDFTKIITGAQGTMGIVFWASVKCEILPDVRKLLMVPADNLESLIDFSYRTQRLRMGDEVMIVNHAQLANMIGANADHISKLKQQLPYWIMLMGVAGRAVYADEKLSVMEQDIIDTAQQFGLNVVTGISGISSRTLLDTILNPSDENYWKLNYKGGCQDIFFMTTLDKTPQYIKTIYSAADTLGFSSSDIGIYIQPQHQGAVYHCEFNLPYDPCNKKDVEKVQALYEKASRELAGQDAYFSRPYGMWSDLVYQRDLDSTTTLRKLKKIFDPNNVMNPGKLCF
ncbi:MAG: FAD-binding oxidoreductase [Eubacteriales bacterium]|nr:FAD-binding oxidoreductase [Eubacteriales bacterium]